jgi:hypothetical protein
MSDQQWEELREKIESLLVEHVNGFILVAECEDKNGKRFTFKAGTESNAMAIGLAGLLIADVLVAREEKCRSEEESETDDD